VVSTDAHAVVSAVSTDGHHRGLDRFDRRPGRGLDKLDRRPALVSTSSTDGPLWSRL